MAQLDLLPEVFEPAQMETPPIALEKSPLALRTIGEVAEELDVPAHVLRFWETKFPEIQPVKMKGARRYYRPEDVTLLARIQHLLYADGYTIKGAQAILNGTLVIGANGEETLIGGLDEKTRAAIHSALAELRKMRSILQSLHRA